MSDLIISNAIVLYVVIGLTFLRMSSKQVIYSSLFVLVTFCLIGIIDGFTRDIRLTCIGLSIEVLILFLLYFLSFKRYGIKFEQPLFNKNENLKKLIEIIKDVYSNNK